MPPNSPAVMTCACVSRLACVYVLVGSVTPSFVGERRPQSAAMGVTDNTASLVKGPKEAYLVLAEKGRDSVRFIDV